MSLRGYFNKKWVKISDTFVGKFMQSLHITDFVRNVTYFCEYITNANKIAKSFFKENSQKVKEILSILEDDYSKDVYKAVIKFRSTSLRGDLLKIWQKNQYFDDCANLTDHESFVDCGAYIGDTISSFLESTKRINSMGGYENIYAFEPDPKNCKILQEFVDKNQLKNVKIFDVAVGKEKGTAYFETGDTANASSKLADTVNSAADAYNRNKIEVKVDAIDNLLSDQKVTFIKMDIEGAETSALDGAVNVIKKQRPKLAICIYHSNEDMINLPLKIKNMVEGDYKFYIRHYSDTWIETVFYAIPV